MQPFKIGDRVEIIGEMAKFYEARLGIIIDVISRPVAVITEFTIRLADGIESNFFDFQLRIPPVIAARLMFDNMRAKAPAGMRGAIQDRNLRFVEGEYDLHIRIADRSDDRSLVCQVVAAQTRLDYAVATLIAQGAVKNATLVNRIGEFTFARLPQGNVEIELLVPSRRILARVEAVAQANTA